MKKHPLYWFLARYEHFIDLGILFAIVVIIGVVVSSLFFAPGHPTYFDRPLP